MATPTPNVRLLSYNIFLRPYFVHSNGNDYKSERLQLFADRMPEYDIICLQEVFDNFTHRNSALCEKAWRKGFRYMARSPAPSFTDKELIDGGLVILSKYQILDSDFCAFKHGIFSDSLTKKGVLYVRIKLQGGLLHLFTTHDQAHYIHEDDKIDLANHYVRLKQLVEAKNYINQKLSEVLRPGDSAIFMGDLNVDANKHDYPMQEAQILFTNVFCQEKDYCKLTNNEYDLLLYIFNNQKSSYEYTDVFYDQHSQFLVTYGDVYPDDYELEKPLVSSIGDCTDPCIRTAQ